MLDIGGGELSPAHLNVIHEALELHRDGLRDALQEATTDGTLESVDDLLEVTGELATDIRLAEEILGAIDVQRITG